MTLILGLVINILAAKFAIKQCNCVSREAYIVYRISLEEFRIENVECRIVGSARGGID